MHKVRSNRQNPDRVDHGLSGTVRDLADEYVAVRVIAIANRLTRGASKFYRDTFDLGVVEWRIMVCLGGSDACAIGEVADAADIDKGAASRSVKVLGDRGLVETRTGSGRVTLVRLTRTGRLLLDQLTAAGRRREHRLMAGFSPAERVALVDLLGRLMAQVDHMNQMNGEDAPERDRVLVAVP